MEDCIFCKIAAGKLQAKFAYQGKEVVAFEDIHKVAEIHILIAPRKHIKSFLNIKSTHLQILLEMVKVAQELVLKLKLDSGKYRLVFNGGEVQKIPHLHWHLLGGNLTGFPE